jgi:HK97 family phage major capsid protein
MSEREIKRYSLVRAISAFANRDWRGAELEREASEATAKRLGAEPRGFYVPADWANQERRDLSVGTASAGGNMVSTDLLSGSFIELLRNRLVLRQAGATVLGDLVGNVAIPAQTGGATAYWVGEAGVVTESQQTVGQVVMSPKTVGAYTDYSRKLMQQSSLDVENFVRSDLAATLQIAIDYAGLHGDPATDANQPRGVALTSGIGSVAGGANGAAPTWANIVALETAVASNNADLGTLGYLTNAKVRGRLKVTEKAASTAQFIWNDNNTLNGYRANVSNQVRSNLTKGTAVGTCSALFYGNWADLLMGLWGGLDIIVDPYSNSTSGTMRVVVFQSVDFAVRNVASFAAMLDALTP